jgi:tetratricopeptide (TPR) repeat protein
LGESGCPRKGKLLLRAGPRKSAIRLIRLLPSLALLVALHSTVATGQTQPLTPPATAPQDRGPRELLSAGEAAFNTGNWQLALDAFSGFLKDYGGVPGTADAVARVNPLVAICQVRLGRFDEAAALLEELLKQPPGDPKQRVDLVFFAALANLRTGKTAIARTQLGQIFSDPKVERGRRMESLILGGMTYVLEKDWPQSISFFEKHTAEIAAYSPEAGARAQILLLHARIQDQQWDAAATLAKTLHEGINEIRQVVTFSSLLIELGGHFLDEGDGYQAIALLRRVPSKLEIEQLQGARLEEADSELSTATQTKNSVRAAQLQTTVEEMRRELKAFAEIPQFDSAARLRLAGAYFQLNRTREACLILDHMVRQMDPDSMVESATATLIRGWMSLARFPRAARTADLYLERFAHMPEKPNLADVMFLHAQALEGQFQYQAAADGYRVVATKFTGKPIAAQANFMAAYNILQLENYPQAGELLERQLKPLSAGDEMWPHVQFWRAMAYYFDQQWSDCRKALEHYLVTTKGEGEYVDDAEFRIGYAYFAEANYPEAVRRLGKFTAAHPESEWLAEAWLALGDAHAAEGDLREAAQAYAAIGSEAPGFHDEGWLKRGNLLKLQKDLSGMRQLFTDFLEQRPQSPRLAEALQWLGWVEKQQGDVEAARRIYWAAITRFGNDAARPGLEDIFLGLQTLYNNPEKPQLATQLSQALEQAKATGQPRFATRLGWALARLHLSDKQLPPALRARDSRLALVALGPGIDPKETAPAILADVADALAEHGEPAQAGIIYEGLRKWWPRAPERDRAYAGLGFIAMRAADEAAALASFDRFEKTSVMPRTPADERGISLVEGELGGKVALARAELLAKRDPEQALHRLLALQKAKSMPARIRATAFMDAARLHVASGRYRESLPYFEQVYLLFNRFPELVADAYYQRGESLEKLGMPEKAREVYSELATREDLVSFKPAQLGLARAQALGGVIEPKVPTEGLIPPSPNNR